MTHESAALATKRNNASGKFPRQNTSNYNKPTCDFCGYVGHVKEKCYKLYGYPPGHKLYKGQNQPDANQASMNSPVLQASSFTPKQYQQILALINTQPRSNLISNNVP